MTKGITKNNLYHHEVFHNKIINIKLNNINYEFNMKY